jgi:hypothetical protein
MAKSVEERVEDCGKVWLDSYKLNGRRPEFDMSNGKKAKKRT